METKKMLWVVKNGDLKGMFSQTALPYVNTGGCPSQMIASYVSTNWRHFPILQFVLFFLGFTIVCGEGKEQFT